MSAPLSIPHEKVTSSNLHSVGYDVPTSTLEVQFRSGGVYRYFRVPQHLFTGLLGAPSKGQYLHRFIKGSYDYKHVGTRAADDK